MQPSASASESRVVLVGAGPWAVYAAERLADGAVRRGVALEVVLVDVRPHGFGPNFSRDLPDYELLNYPLAAVDPWEDGRSRVLPPELHTLEAWLARRGSGAAPERTEPVPRGEVGAYFAAVLAHLVAADPAPARVRTSSGWVTDLERVARGWRVRCRGGPDLEAAHVLLATGVPFDAPPDAEAQELGDHAARHGLAYAHRWTRPRDLSRIPPGEPAAVLGLGITFVDVALSLTEGRGGRFEEARDGRLRYRPSGREPRPLLGFSRSGRIPAPKSVGAWPHREGHPLEVLVPAEVERLRARGGAWSFEEDLWPLVREEMDRELARLGAAPLRADVGSVELAEALSELPGGPDDDHHDRVLRRLRTDLELALRGAEGSREQALADVWSRAFGRVAYLASCGGLTAGSQERFEAEVRPRWGRLAFGPPPVNARKVEALLADRVVDLSLARDGSIEADADAYRLVSADGSARVRSLVDARIPGFDLGRPPPLYGRLAERGWIRAFVNRTGGRHRTGGVEVGLDGFVVGDAEAPGLGVVGAPTEGCVLGTDALPSSRVEWPGRWARAVLDRLA